MTVAKMEARLVFEEYSSGLKQDGHSMYQVGVRSAQRRAVSAPIFAAQCGQVEVIREPNVLGEGPPERRSRGGNREAQLLGGPSRPAG